MSDLISRKQTIDALRTCYDTERIDYDNGKEYIDYEQALDLIKELPSADVPDINVGDINCTDCIKHGGDWECNHVNCHKGKNVPNDVISRKQAIEAMGEEPMVWTEDDEYAQGQLNMWEAAVVALRELPPVVSADLIHLQKEQAYMQGYEDGRKPRKGKWVITSEFKDCYYAKCNQCKVTQVFYYNKPLTNFCPNCGCRNIGEGEQDDSV